MMLQSAFVLPGGPFREINRASWSHVRGVCVLIAKKLIGLIALMAACAVNIRSSHGGRRIDLLVYIYFLAAIAALVALCCTIEGLRTIIPCTRLFSGAS
jgi:archaellum biogenesis protein FlaJ (TadC family)